MKGLIGGLKGLFFGYQLKNNPEEGLNVLESLFYFILIASFIICCVYIIKDIVSLFKKKKLRQSREESESKEGEVSIYKKSKKSEPKNNNTGEYVDFENIDDK
tara:strand:- start:314 stop:622 length:309 start_codon:yes stop_codon:yes gene_type:complete